MKYFISFLLFFTFLSIKGQCDNSGYILKKKDLRDIENCTITSMGISWNPLFGTQKIKLKYPDSLISLDIRDNYRVLLLDTFTNLRYIGIEEGGGKQLIKLQLNDTLLDGLSLYPFELKFYYLLTRFPNLITLGIGIKENPDSLINCLTKMEKLEKLSIFNKSNFYFSDSFNLLEKLTFLKGNFYFDNSNISKINRLIFLKKLEFYSLEITSIPDNLKYCKQDIEIRFSHCKLSKSLRKEIEAIHKNTYFEYCIE